MENLDFISPDISLNYKGSKHKNKFAGMLTIIVAICSCVITVYFGLELWERKQPKAYLITKYVDDIGAVKKDQTSMYHMISFYDLRMSNPRSFDSSIITISGVLYDSSRIPMSTYEYDRCIYDIDANGGIETLYPDKETFEKYHCIRKYTDLKTNKTYIQDGKNEEFVYPAIEHGMNSLSKIPTIYTLTGSRCSHSNTCASEEVIEEFLSTSIYAFLLTDNYLDVTNYGVPAIRYRNSFAGVIKGSSYVDNNINLVKVNITTNDGFLFNNKKEIMSYRVTQNEKITNQKPMDDPTLFTVSLYAQNMYEIYDRAYDKVQDILANVGGVIKAFMIIGGFFNYFTNNYQVVLDTYTFLKVNDHIDKKNDNNNIVKPIPLLTSSHAKSEVKLEPQLTSYQNIKTQILFP